MPLCYDFLDMSHFNDEKVHFINSGLKGLLEYSESNLNVLL